MMVRERVSVLLLLALMSCGNEIARSDRGSVPVVSTLAPMPSSTTPTSDSPVAPLSTREIEADYERHNSIDELIASAQLIVVGSVVDVESLGRPSLNEDPHAEEYAAFTIHVDEQLMGDPVNEVTLAWDSYVVDGNGERIGEVVMNGVPVPRMYDTMLLFLQTADPAFAGFLGGVPTHQPVGLDGVVYIRSGVAADGDVTSPASAQIQGWTLDELRNAVSAATTEPANGADLDLLTMPPSFFTIAPCARLIEDLGTAGLEADVFPDYFYADLEAAVEQSDAIATASVVSIEQSVVITPTGMTPGQVTDTGARTVETSLGPRRSSGCASTKCLPEPRPPRWSSSRWAASPKPRLRPSRRGSDCSCSPTTCPLTVARTDRSGSTNGGSTGTRSTRSTSYVRSRTRWDSARVSLSFREVRSARWLPTFANSRSHEARSQTAQRRAVAFLHPPSGWWVTKPRSSRRDPWTTNS
jgi:hypothetical protein